MEARVGSDAKADCLVVARQAERASVAVATKNRNLLENGIRAVAEGVLAALGRPGVAVEVQDQGALDYVLAARIETAVRTVLPEAKLTRSERVERAASDPDRPRRSRLYAPGNNPRLLVGIDIHGADCVLLDLEDSVPPGDKAAARTLVRRLLAAVPFPDEVWVRINPLDAGGREDVAEVLEGRPHGVCLPKAESGEGVRELSKELGKIERRLGFDVGSTHIMPIIETARGVLRCEDVAEADERVVVVAFGAEDYTRDVGARRTNEALLFARSRVVAAAKAAGVQASDTVYADLANDAGLAEECARARDLGFDGKGAINPRQIPILHHAFSPTEEELAKARAIVEAAREAESRGLGAVAVDGRMVDQPVLERARRLIKYAEKLAKGGAA
ncbi:MAG: aldolase/citrate lyase family protein [Candidatus Bipolaricaulota bacterium]|nr:aldolase/citrate lyase family protein [Candidatus Bipolaricaulota bacterium]